VQAAALAALCAVLFLGAALLPGRALVPFAPELLDVHQAEAAAGVRRIDYDDVRGNVGMADKYFQSLCWDRVLRDRLRGGEVPRWTRDIGGGAPFVPQMAQPFHPRSALLLLLSSEGWYGWSYLLHMVLFGWFAYVFFRRVGCAHAAGLFAVVVATLGLWVQSKVHHDVILSAALPLWAMLLATHDVTSAGRGGAVRLHAGAWLGVATGMSWLSGFATVSLQATYLCLAFGAWRVVRVPRRERAACVLALGGAMALAAGIAAANVLPIVFAYLDSARRGVFDEALLSQQGLEWAHLLTIAWPDLLAQAGDHVYPPIEGGRAADWLTRQPWSQHVLLADPTSPVDGSAFQGWVETSFSVGACAAACVVMAWSRARTRALATFFALAGVVAFGVATATEPWLTLSGFVPGLQSGDLRRCGFVVSMSLVALSTLGVDAIGDGARRWPLWAAFGAVATASSVALAWLLTRGDAFVEGMVSMYGVDAEPARLAGVVRRTAAVGEIEHNRAALLSTASRALLVAAAAFGATLLRVRWRCGALAALVAIELLHVGRGPVQTTPVERLRAAPAVLAPVLAATPDRGPRPRLARLMRADGRLDQGLPGNFPGYLGVEDASFYSPLAPRRAMEFFEAIEAGVAYPTAGVGSFRDPASLRHPLCDLFGVRFVLSDAAHVATDALVDRTPAATGGFRLYERTTTLPRATFVSTVDVIPDAARRLAALRDPDRDVARRVVLEDAAAPLPSGDAARPAIVELVEHADERVVVRVDADVAATCGWRIRTTPAGVRASTATPRRSTWPTTTCAPCSCRPGGTRWCSTTRPRASSGRRASARSRPASPSFCCSCVAGAELRPQPIDLVELLLREPEVDEQHVAQLLAEVARLVVQAAVEHVVLAGHLVELVARDAHAGAAGVGDADVETHHVERRAVVVLEDVATGL